MRSWLNWKQHYLGIPAEVPGVDLEEHHSSDKGGQLEATAEAMAHAVLMRGPEVA